jgi:uncharacterized protein YbjT (DUF2867 family)
MILVIGASGILGTAVISELYQEGYSIRAASRSPEKLSEKLPKDILVSKVDLTDAATMEKALEDVDTVVAAAHSLLGSGANSSAKVDEKGIKHLIEAARQKGVRHFIYVSIYMASESSASAFVRRKFRMERYLINSGIPFTIIRPSAFMEVHAHQLLGSGILKNGKALIMGKGDKPCNYVAAGDVAELIRKIVKEGPSNEILDVGGPDNTSKIELAGLYGKLSGRQVKMIHIPLVVLKLVSGMAKPFHSGISQVTEISVAFDSIDMSLDTRELVQRFSLKQTSLQDFVSYKVGEHKP